MFFIPMTEIHKQFIPGYWSLLNCSRITGLWTPANESNASALRWETNSLSPIQTTPMAHQTLCWWEQSKITKRAAVHAITRKPFKNIYHRTYWNHKALYNMVSGKILSTYEIDHVTYENDHVTFKCKVY